jgi:purine-binding chemotaxis protein CheW
MSEAIHHTNGHVHDAEIELSNLSNSQILEKIRSLQTTRSAAKQPLARRRLLTFSLSDQWFALDVSHVKEISRLGTVTRVPLVRDHVLGVVNLRGNITAVIDVRSLLALPRKPLSSSARVVVIKSDNLEAGIVAEVVSEVVEVNRDTIEPPLLTIDREIAKFYDGTFNQTGNQTICLNPGAILAIGKPF